MLRIHTVVCPLDFSEPSYKALQIAVEIAMYFKAELVLVHIVSPVAPGIPADPGFAFAGQEEYDLAARETAEKELAAAIQRIPSEIKSRTAIGMGGAADQIVRMANSDAADLIVIATHGLTGWRHLVFGSIAERVIRISGRPVLVIPAHEAKA